MYEQCGTAITGEEKDSFTVKEFVMSEQKKMNRRDFLLAAAAASGAATPRRGGKATHWLSRGSDDRILAARAVAEATTDDLRRGSVRLVRDAQASR